MTNGLRVLVGVLAVAAFAIGCGSTSPTATPAPICAVVIQMHQARESLLAAFSSAQAGRVEDAMERGAEARRLATSGLRQLHSLAEGPEHQRALWEVLTAVGVNIDNAALPFVGIGVGAAPTVEEMVRLGRQALPVVDRTLGTADAIAQRNQDGSPGPCVTLAFGSRLPTLPPLPTPDDGPVPSGDVLDQAVAALNALGLKAAKDIEFDAPSRIRWLRTFLLDDLSLENAGDAEARFPIDLTVLRWDGQAWQPMPCLGEDPQSITNAGTMCGVVNTNAQSLPARTRLASDDRSLSFSWPGTATVPPATYALVVPIWRSADEYPIGIPTEGAVAIVVVTSNP